MSQLSDFIDRAKLEALADERYRNDPSSDAFDAYMQAVDDVIALLDAETTEEWGVRHISVDGWPSDLAHTSKEAAERDLGTCGWNCHLISRRVAVTPWLPSEGGEKRG